MKRLLLAIAVLCVAASCARDPTPPPNPNPSPSPSPQPADFAVVGSPAFINANGTQDTNLAAIPQTDTIRITFNANINPATVLVNATSMSSVTLTYADSTGYVVDMPGVSASVSGNVMTISAAGGFFGGSSYT